MALSRTFYGSCARSVRAAQWQTCRLRAASCVGSRLGGGKEGLPARGRRIVFAQCSTFRFAQPEAFTEIRVERTEVGVDFVECGLQEGRMHAPEDFHGFARQSHPRGFGQL